MVCNPFISLATSTYTQVNSLHHGKDLEERLQTWKKSYERPMLPKTDGSSEQSVTGTPWFITAGSGCVGIDEVSLWKVQESVGVRDCRKTSSVWLTRISFLRPSSQYMDDLELLNDVRDGANLDRNVPLSAYLHEFRVFDQRKPGRG